jgi:tryptophan synthase alpha subunit
MAIKVGAVTIDGESFSRPFKGGGTLSVPYVAQTEDGIRAALKIIKATEEEIAEILELVLS